MGSAQKESEILAAQIMEQAGVKKERPERRSARAQATFLAACGILALI
jgi:hypothetical protein